MNRAQLTALMTASLLGCRIQRGGVLDKTSRQVDIPSDAEINACMMIADHIIDLIDVRTIDKITAAK